MFLVLSFFVLPGVSKMMLAAIGDCEAYGYDERGLNGPRSKSFLRMDRSVECYTSEHQSIRTVAYIFFVVWPFGVPTIFLVLLISCSDAIKTRHPTTLSRATSFLWVDYQPAYYWWELLATLHRLSLTAFVLFIPSKAPLLRLCVALLIAFAYTTLLTSMEPFRSHVVKIIAHIGHLLLCFLLLGCLMLKICEEEDACSFGFGFADPFALSLLVLFGSTAMLLLVFMASVYRAVEHRREKALLSPADTALLQELMRSAGRGESRRAEGTGRLSRGQLLGNAPHLWGSLHTKGQEVSERVSSWLGSIERNIIAGALEAPHFLSGCSSKFEQVLRETSSKFVDDGKNMLILGSPSDAALGLSHYMGVEDPFGQGDAGVGLIREEVARFVKSVCDLDGDSDAFAEAKGWSRAPAEASVAAVKELVSQDCQGFLNYILYHTTEEKEFHNGVRDHGRGHVGLDYFVSHPHARQAGLAKAHVVALRLYTTHAFKYLNSPLRAGKKPHPLPITVTYISEGIKKLRAVYASQQDVTTPTSLWRGMRSLKLSDDFLHGAGGTEVAPMSTTSELSVAVQYGLSANSILFKVRVNNCLQYGADLQWLSAFPSEAEVCFPPLTYLQPTGKTQKVKVGDFSFHVVEVSPAIP